MIYRRYGVLLILLFITNSIVAQNSTLFSDDFSDNTNNWVTFSDNRGYATVENGEYVFSISAGSDVEDQFIVPYQGNLDELTLYPRFQILMDVSGDRCFLRCFFRIIVGYNEDRITYLEYEYSIYEDSMVWLRSVSPGSRSVPAILDSRRVGTSAINIFDGQSHEIFVSVNNEWATLLIDDEEMGQLNVEAGEQNRYQPTGLVGFGFNIDGTEGPVTLRIDNFEVRGSSNNLQPSPTPIPPTAIPEAVIADATASGFSYETVATFDANDIKAMTISETGDRVALVYNNGVAVLTEDGNQINIPLTGMVFASSAEFSPLTNTIAIGGADLEAMFGEGRIEVYDLDTSASDGTIIGTDFSTPEEGSIVDIAITPDYLLGLTEFGVLKIWDADDYVGAIVHVRALLSPYGVNVFDVNNDGTIVATGGSDDRLNLWELNNISEPATTIRTPNPVRLLQFRPNSSHVVYTSCDDRDCTTGTRVIDSNSGDELFALDRALFPLFYTSDGEYIVGNDRRGLAIFDADNGTYLGTLGIFDDLNPRGVSWAEVGPVRDGGFLYYARYCSATGTFGCSNYNLLITQINF